MQKYISMLCRNKLFEGIPEGEIPVIIKSLGANIKKFEKGQYIAFQGERLPRAGIILGGKVRLQKETEQNTFIINDYKTGDMFGEALAFEKTALLPFNILATAESEILFLDFARAETNGTLMKNLLRVFAVRILFFHTKLDILREHTIREKLFRFFESFYARHGQEWFLLPYNRERLAEYLSVNRSALCRELGNMKRGGVIDFEKNKFKICIPLFKKM